MGSGTSASRNVSRHLRKPYFGDIIGGKYMKLINMKSGFILDSDTVTDVIHIEHEDIPNGMFYFKHRHLEYSFKGEEIKDPDDYIRIKSVWYTDFKDQTKIEVIPFGEFDINEAKIFGNYLYFTKISDKDNDGFLNNDYCGGEIHRINIKNFQIEFCCDISPYNFHGFEMATERYIVFRSEDQIPDTTEIIFIDLKNRKKAVLTNSWDMEDMEIKFIFDEEHNIKYVITKRFVFDGDLSSENNKLMCFEWDAFVSKLEWNELK
jgi:hypothetical protein